MAMRRSSRAPKPIERYGPPVETIFVEEEDEGGSTSKGAKLRVEDAGTTEQAWRSAIEVTKPPKRDPKTGCFKFEPGPTHKSSAEMAAAVRSFQPNLSPEEVLRGGAFGGTYFRSIDSAVTRVRYVNQWLELSPEWISGLDPRRYLAKPWPKYDITVNKYKAQCGQTLEAWEGSGWILAQDPYGWFQWYCRFFQGRRSPDDARQISRWNKACGPKGRWKSNLCGKVIIAGKAFDDPSVSPVVRQTLMHWGYELTEADFQAVASRIKKGSGATYVPREALDAAVQRQRKARGARASKRGADGEGEGGADEGEGEVKGPASSNKGTGRKRAKTTKR